jgi:hypothetical protein
MSEIREALTAAGASPFVPKIIDPVLVEYQRRFAPWCRAVPTKKVNSTTYFFNTRTVNVSGGAVPDGGARPVSTSTYTQGSFNMAHVQAVGSVTGYAQAVTTDLIDLRATEINGAIKGYYWDIETFMGWGNSASTLGGAQPQFDGLDTQIQQFSAGGAQNVIDYAGRSLSLSTLDELLVMVSGNAAERVADSSWMFVLSVTAEARIAQLLTAQQRYDNVEVEAGLIVASYKRVPLVPSSFLSTLGYAMGTVTAATATTGGTLASGTYRYQVSAVIARQGEILPSVEVSQTTTGSTSVNTLSFSSPAGQDGLGPQLYKVWRTTGTGASGSETFLGYVDSTVGLMSDGVTPIYANQIVDTGTALIPQQSSGSIVPGVLPTQYYGTNASMLPAAAGQENIYLMSRDAGNIVRPFVREAMPLDVYPTTSAPDAMPFAIMGDTCMAVRTPKFAGRAYRVGVAA